MTDNETRESIVRMATAILEDASADGEFSFSDARKTALMINKVSREILNIRDMVAGGKSVARAAFAAKHKISSDWQNSIGDHDIECLECGKRFKSLAKHIQAKHGMSTAEYRGKHGIPGNVPLCGKQISAEKSKRAKEMGLGDYAKKKSNK